MTSEIHNGKVELSLSQANDTLENGSALLIFNNRHYFCSHYTYFSEGMPLQVH